MGLYWAQSGGAVGFVPAKPPLLPHAPSQLAAALAARCCGRFRHRAAAGRSAGRSGEGGIPFINPETIAAPAPAERLSGRFDRSSSARARATGQRPRGPVGCCPVRVGCAPQGAALVQCAGRLSGGLVASWHLGMLPVPAEGWWARRGAWFPPAAVPRFWVHLR